jgi:hypothetical protein
MQSLSHRKMTCSLHEYHIQPYLLTDPVSPSNTKGWSYTIYSHTCWQTQCHLLILKDGLIPYTAIPVDRPSHRNQCHLLILKDGLIPYTAIIFSIIMERTSYFSAISWREQVIFRWDNDCILKQSFSHRNVTCSHLDFFLWTVV